MDRRVDQYLDHLKNPSHRDDLITLRGFIRAELPDAEEDLKYGMPTYSQNGEVVVALASQKHYMSIYMDDQHVAAHRDELGDLDYGKSCIRFKQLANLPLDIIATILHETVEKQAAEDRDTA